jgi:tRNA/rRNA methyltransferase
MRAHNAPIIILVRPKFAENIGATARAMGNFGASDLRLVQPVDFDRKHALALATHSKEILENASVFPSLDEALEGVSLAIATTRRARKIEIPAVHPDSLFFDQQVAQAEKIALVFGNERNGLSNPELFSCDLCSTIPTLDKKSLNLSQSVIIYLYEWFKSSHLRRDQIMPEPRSKPVLADRDTRIRAYSKLKGLLERKGYKPEEKIQLLMRKTVTLFEKAKPVKKDYQLLLTLLHWLEKRDASVQNGRDGTP